MEDHIILMYARTPSYLEHQCELGKNDSCIVKEAILLAHKSVSCNEEHNYSCSYQAIISYLSTLQTYEYIGLHF